MRKIRDCPCGTDHRVSEHAWHRLQNMHSTILIGNGDIGAWRVPRIFVAMHCPKASELRALAERYGWEKL